MDTEDSSSSGDVEDLPFFSQTNYPERTKAEHAGLLFFPPAISIITRQNASLGGQLSSRYNSPLPKYGEVYPAEGFPPPSLDFWSSPGRH